MKTKFLSKSMLWTSVTAFAMAGMLGLSACDKDDDDDMPKAKYSISGTASGGQEVPAVTTSASATLSGSYDTVSKTLDYTINWTGLSGDATMAHFHGPALVGENAPPIETLTITSNGINGTAKATITASAVLHTALMAGKVYYNIHTAANPDGEVRSQVNLAQ